MAASRKQASVKSGFTLVELLVVISIIAILMGLLIPAVGAARETARRNECSTKINNFAKAAIQYEMSHKGMPGYHMNYGTYTNSGVVDPSDPENTTATAVAHAKLGGWVVSLLPQLDAQPTYEVWTQDKYPVIVDDSGNKFTKNAAPNLVILQCASSTTADSDQGRNSYVANAGLYCLTTAPPTSLATAPSYALRSTANTPAGSTTTETLDFHRAQKKDNGVFNYKYGENANGVEPGPSVKIEDLKDGAGNTVLFSENLHALPWHLCVPDSSGGISATPTISLLSTDSSSSTTGMQASFSFFPQLAQGFVWHYRDNKGMATGFNGSTAIDNNSPFVVPAINEGFGTEDLSITRMSTTNAHLVARPSSNHPDGVNMGFADGSSRYVVDSINYRVYQALMTPRGKSSDVPLREFVPTGEEI